MVTAGLQIGEWKQKSFTFEEKLGKYTAKIVKEMRIFQISSQKYENEKTFWISYNCAQ